MSYKTLCAPRSSNNSAVDEVYTDECFSHAIHLVLHGALWGNNKSRKKYSICQSPQAVHQSKSVEGLIALRCPPPTSIFLSCICYWRKLEYRLVPLFTKYFPVMQMSTHWSLTLCNLVKPYEFLYKYKINRITTERATLRPDNNTSLHSYLRVFKQHHISKTIDFYGLNYGK